MASAAPPLLALMRLVMVRHRSPTTLAMGLVKEGYASPSGILGGEDAWATLEQGLACQ